MKSTSKQKLYLLACYDANGKIAAGKVMYSNTWEDSVQQIKDDGMELSNGFTIFEINPFLYNCLEFAGGRLDPVEIALIMIRCQASERYSTF